MTRMEPMPTCREVIEFLDAYVERTLEPRERLRFETHLGACADCRTYLAQYRATQDLARNAHGDPAAELPEDLVRAILSTRRAAPAATPPAAGKPRRRP